MTMERILGRINERLTALEKAVGLSDRAANDERVPAKFGYCSPNEVVYIRLYQEEGHWWIDGKSADGRYTEDHHGWTTAKEAQADVTKFCEENGVSLSLPVYDGGGNLISNTAEALNVTCSVAPVLARMIGGHDCTEDESVLILDYLDVGIGDFRDRIIENCPLEYDQWCSEVQRGDRRPSDRVWDITPERVRAAADPSSVEPAPVTAPSGVESLDLSDSEMADFQDVRSLGRYWPASAEGVEEVLRSTVGDANGRSPWTWVRLFNGDLLLATFPRGETYESVSDGISEADWLRARENEHGSTSP